MSEQSPLLSSDLNTAALGKTWEELQKRPSPRLLLEDNAALVADVEDLIRQKQAGTDIRIVPASWRNIEIQESVQCCCCHRGSVRCVVFRSGDFEDHAPVCYECLTAVRLALRDTGTPAPTDEV